MAVAVQTTSTSNLADATTVTLTKPTGLMVGDLLVACVYSDEEDVAVLSGWTELADLDDAVLGYLTMQYKIADSGDVAASNFTFTIGTTGACGGVMFRISGHSPTALFSDFETDFDNNTSGNYNFSGLSVVPRANSELVIVFLAASQTNTAGASSSVVINGTNPTWTEVLDSNLIQSAGNYAHLGVYYATQATATTITDVDATLTGTDGSTDHGLIIATLSPQQDATGTFTFLTTTPAFFATTEQVGVNGTNTLLSVSPTLNAPTARATTPTQWSNEDKPSTDWTNETL